MRGNGIIEPCGVYINNRRACSHIKLALRYLRPKPWQRIWRASKLRSERIFRTSGGTRALTGDAARADDLVQDTLERAWIKFHLWRSNFGLRPWLFAIMHNLYVNQVRSPARHTQTGLSDEHAHDMVARPNQTDLLEVGEIDTCLARPSWEQREVLLLVSLEDMTYQQVAQILGIPVGTVTSRLARARARLKELLDGGAEPPSLKVIK